MNVERKLHFHFVRVAHDLNLEMNTRIVLALFLFEQRIKKKCVYSRSILFASQSNLEPLKYGTHCISHSKHHVLKKKNHSLISMILVCVRFLFLHNQTKIFHSSVEKLCFYSLFSTLYASPICAEQKKIRKNTTNQIWRK